MILKLLMLALVLLGSASAQGIPDPRCPLVNSNPPTLFPHDTDCSLFYICSFGQRQVEFY